MAPPSQKPSSKKLVCGFFLPDGTAVSEASVRAAVVAAAVRERSTWRAGTALQKEDEPARFGDLVRYWLAGSSGGIRPDRLVAAQQAATASSVPYGTLVHTALRTAVAKFKTASAKADTAIADVYTKWDAIDAAAVVVNAAADKVTAGKAEVTSAKAAVKAATAKVQEAEARAALTSANTALATARREQDDAKRKHQAALKDRDAARVARAKAISARDRLKDDARKIEAANRKAVRGTIVAAAPSGSVPGLDGAIEDALLKAHDFSSDIDAWSAVFVGSCVRAAAITLKLEGVVGGRHEGKDGLLAVSFRHAEYVIAARGRKKGKQGAYLAFEPKGRVIKKGDIIATDRAEEVTMTTRITLRGLAGRRNLHCDIVCDVKTDGAQPYAETLGGNVTHTVRRRRYPLTATGQLIVSSTDFYIQEDDTGKFGTFSPLPMPPSVLKPRSTGRIFAVLSLVEGCDMVDESEIQTDVSARSPWRVPTGEGAFMKRLETLESPFLDQEILPVERQEFDWVGTHEQSIEESGSEFLDERDDDESESFYEVESLAREDEPTQERGEDVASEWEAALLEAEQGDEPYAQEEPDTLLEREDGDLDPADSIDEAAAQYLFPQTVRDRVEPLLDAAAARTASAWNAARHPKASGVSAAALLTRLERYVNRPAIENAMQKTAGLKDLSGDAGIVIAMMAHQFQQKIYTSTKSYHAGQIGEGTLDALGFVRHRGDELNAVDALNVRFHVRGRSKAFQRLQQVYRSDRAAFEHLGTDVSPKTWYRLFVNAPFLGRPFTKGIHIELMRRLRQAEKWLLGQSLYKQMSPVELGAAMKIDEDHHGGRTTTNNSMHTLGLAVDIRYTKNPWVAGQHDNSGKLNVSRNTAFQTVTRNISRLLDGADEAVTPAWLHGLASDPARTSVSAYNELKKRQTNLQVYLSLQNDTEALKATIARRRQGPKSELVMKARETDDAAVARWRRTIRDDRERLHRAFGSGRTPEAGFMNLEACAGVRAPGSRLPGVGRDRSGIERQRRHDALRLPRHWNWLEAVPRAAANGGRQSSVCEIDCRVRGRGVGDAAHAFRTADGAVPRGTTLVVHVEYAADEDRGVLPQGSQFAEDGRRACVRTRPSRSLRSRAQDDRRAHQEQTIRAGQACGRFGPRDRARRPLHGLAESQDERLEVRSLLPGQHAPARTPARLNGVVREALLEVGRVFGTAAPSIQNLILAGHSKAYEFFDPLAMAHGDPEGSKGCLAKLSDVWALDTSYTCPTDHWLCWLSSKPNLKMQIFFRNGSSTGACGWRFASVAKKTGKRMQVFSVTEGHCAVPATRLPKLLNPASTPAKPKAKKELEEEGFEREEFDQEEFEPEEALREDQGVESAEYDTDEAETGTQEGAEWESVVDEPLEATDEELEADEADYEQGLDTKVSEAEDEDEDEDADKS
jgi:hypothetical protein